MSSRGKDKGELEVTIPEALSMAVQLHRTGRLEKAEEIYRGVLRSDADHPDALHFLGILKHQQGESGEAVTLIRRSFTREPGHAAAHLNLGNVLKESGQVQEALESYHKVIALDPANVHAFNNLGVVYKTVQDLPQAEEHLRRAIELDPEFADAHHNLANVLTRSGRESEAVASWKEALRLRPDYSEAQRNLSDSFHRSGEEEEAIAMFRDTLRQDPENPIARHMLSAFTGDDVPGRASDGFVRNIFDGFASAFDEHLAELGYRAPGLVARVCRDWVGRESDRLDVLDAGCGTGLCGPDLRPLARRLVGIDLSPGMLTKAQGRGVYDHLEVVEITGYLERHPGAFDLVVAADTFNYFGDLQPLFRELARAVRPRGAVVFTLEAEEESVPSGYRLHPHGRYGHDRTYVEQVIRQAGFREVEMQLETLRFEHGEPVQGLIIRASR